MEIHYGEAEIRRLRKHYGVGDSPLINFDDLMTEWVDLRVCMILKCRTKSMREIIQLLAKSNGSMSLAYPNCSKLAQFALLLPTATADSERAFSTMRRIKRHLRSGMSNSTLNHCMRISMEGPCLEEFDFYKLIETWSNLKNILTVSTDNIRNACFCHTV